MLGAGRKEPAVSESPEPPEVEIHGTCDPRFERVKEAFAKSFAQGEVGAAVSVVVDGETVVDLWAGHRDAARTKPWERDTIVNTYSTTKGMTAICALQLIERGELDPDAPVSELWPEFAQAGKADIPVRWLLSHRAGLAAVSKPLPEGAATDWDCMVEALAAQAPWWTPGEKHGYHALTYGYLVGEVVRRVSGRSLGTFFREEVAEPLGADFHIGFGAEHDDRCAEMIPPPPTPGAADPMAAARKDPDSLVGRAFGNPDPGSRNVNSRAWRAAEVPAAGGHGDARGLARIYGALARGGEIDGVHVLSPETLEKATTEQSFGTDAVLSPLQTRFGLGFMLTQPMIPFGPNPNAFGHPGAGGSIAFADPDARLGFGYVMNQMSMGLSGGMFGFALMHQVYESLAD
jgi:CubicO group peptidase (beta-lactamase class C family)